MAEMMIETEEATRDMGALQIYMKQISEIPELSEDEFNDILKMLKQPANRQKAIDRLIEGNLKLVVAIAHKWKGIGLGVEDLIAEGNIALVNAAEKFDEKYGKSFATYAKWWIDVKMSRAINAAKNIRIPVNSELNKRRITRAVNEFTAAYGREPTPEEIEQITGFSKQIQKNVKQLDNTVLSINQKFDDSDSDSDEIGDILTLESGNSPVDNIVKNEDIDIVRQAMKSLDERSRIILEMRFGFGDKEIATLEQVSSVIGKTRERCRQLEKEAMKKLQAIVENYMEQ